MRCCGAGSLLQTLGLRPRHPPQPAHPFDRMTLLGTARVAALPSHNMGSPDSADQSAAVAATLRDPRAIGFQLLPRRWVVERTLAWLNRNRRLAKDFEASIASAKAWVYIASVQLLVRRLGCS